MKAKTIITHLNLIVIAIMLFGCSSANQRHENISLLDRSYQADPLKTQLLRMYGPHDCAIVLKYTDRLRYTRELSTIEFHLISKDYSNNKKHSDWHLYMIKDEEVLLYDYWFGPSEELFINQAINWFMQQSTVSWKPSPSEYLPLTPEVYLSVDNEQIYVNKFEAPNLSDNKYADLTALIHNLKSILLDVLLRANLREETYNVME